MRPRDFFRSILNLRGRRGGGLRLRGGDVAVNVEDVGQLARRRLPRALWDFLDGGAEDEVTLRANRDAFRAVGLEPEVLVDCSSLDTSVELFGQRCALPLILAPTGYSRLFHPDGERAVASAARRAGIPYVLSTMATVSIEEVRSVSDGMLWFQVYTWKDRGLVAELIARAQNSGFQGLVLTVDVAVLGRRERDLRRGLTIPPTPGWSTILDGVRHPRWASGFLRGDTPVFANVVGRRDDLDVAADRASYVMANFDQKLSWRDLEWFRERWSGPFIVKGLLNASAARSAVDAAVDGVYISNHGGRQLDGAPATLTRVRSIREEVGEAMPLIVDGGIRRGSDVVKAVASGASAVAVGRPYLYGLAAAGERGVDAVISVFDEELRRTMALVGRTRVGDIDGSVLAHRADRGR